MCLLVGIIRFYPELKCYFFSCWMNLLMNGQTRLSKVCVPLHVAHHVSVDLHGMLAFVTTMLAWSMWQPLLFMRILLT